MNGSACTMFVVRLRRPILLLVLLLTAGAVVNVGVAWAAARWGSHRPQRVVAGVVMAERVPPDVLRFLDELEARAGENANGRRPVMMMDVEAAPPGGLVLDPSLAPGKAQTPGGPLTGLDVEERRGVWSTRLAYSRWVGRQFMGFSRTHTTVSFGWPLRSLAYEERSIYRSGGLPGVVVWRPPGWRGGFPIAPSERVQDGMAYQPPSRVYPTVMLTAGFVVNSVVYAGVVGAGVMVPRFVRARWRRRRGLCAGCGYPVGVSVVCTECGARIMRAEAPRG